LNVLGVSLKEFGVAAIRQCIVARHATLPKIERIRRLTP
jgi:hypothetical protein